MKPMTQGQELAAGIKAAAATGIVATTWLADLEMWMRISASAAAIVVAAMSGWYYYEKAKGAHNERKEAEVSNSGATEK